MSEAKTEETKALALPEAVARRGIVEAQWRTLCNSLYPGANPNSVLLVWDYCASRKLDPMKKPCHIVPMEVKDAKTGEYAWRDVVMPGIYEYRTTAHRTREYLGHSEPEYGPEETAFGVSAPAWCKMTVYRWNVEAKLKVEFPVQVFFTEVVATRKNRETKALEANARWQRAPKQMLAKCTEAAGIREAFPEEIGGEPTAEEMDGQRAITIDMTPVLTPPAPFEKLPEALRDNLERAFAELGFSAAQRLAKVNECLGADGVVPEEAAEKLLLWCREEHGKRKAAPTTPRDSGDNGKPKSKKATEKPADPTPALPPVTAATPPPSQDLF